MPITPESVLLTGRRRGRHGRARRGSGRRSRSRSPRFGADVAICDRDADGLARTAADDRGSRTPRARRAARRPRRRRGARRGSRPSTRVDVLVNNAGGGFRADVPRRERQGPGRADPRELHERHATSSARASPKMPDDGRVDRQHHVDRGAPRRARLRGVQRDEGRGRRTSRRRSRSSSATATSASTASPPTSSRRPASAATCR